MKSNWRFTIKMVTCCSLVDQVDTTHTLIINVNNMWTWDWNFCGWSFHSLLNSWCWLHARNVTEQHCDWSCIKPFSASNFFHKLIYVINSLHLCVWFHFRHSFHIHFNSTISVKAFVDVKGWTFEEIVKENGTGCVFNALCQGKNNTGSKVLFSAFFLT